MSRNNKSNVHGYVTKNGVVFTTTSRLVHAHNALKKPMVVAEPGDLVNIDGDRIHNLSRASIGNPAIIFPVYGTRFVKSRVA